MKKYLNIFALIIVSTLIGCTEEKDYRIVSVGEGNVNFMASNVTVSAKDTVDFAESAIYRYDFYPDDYREKEKFFTVDFAYYYDYEDGDRNFYSLNVYLPYKNTLWAGGNNDIKVVFSPSCPEEKSATFTFPDGEKVELSSERPSYVWQLNKESYREASNNGYSWDLLPIFAISRYVKDGIEHVNSGYVLISLENEGFNIFYDEEEKVWFFKNWID